jgi:hypothetical protein
MVEISLAMVGKGFRGLKLNLWGNALFS